MYCTDVTHALGDLIIRCHTYMHAAATSRLRFAHPRCYKAQLPSVPDVRHRPAVRAGQCRRRNDAGSRSFSCGEAHGNVRAVISYRQESARCPQQSVHAAEYQGSGPHCSMLINGADHQFAAPGHVQHAGTHRVHGGGAIAPFLQGCKPEKVKRPSPGCKKREIVTACRVSAGHILTTSGYGKQQHAEPQRAQ